MLVVMTVLAMLMASVGAYITGLRRDSLAGQVGSDADATETRVVEFNNSSIRPGQFPEKRPDNVVTTPGLSNYHANADVVDVGPTGHGDGANVVLVRRDGKGETLADKMTPSGESPGASVFKRRLLDFEATTGVWEENDAVKVLTFVPDFLAKEPSSVVLKADETKDLGDANNAYKEFLWLLLINSPGTDAENRTVQVFRLEAADCSGAVSSNTAVSRRAQPDPSPMTPKMVSDLKADADGCTGSSADVVALIYEVV